MEDRKLDESAINDKLKDCHNAEFYNVRGDYLYYLKGGVLSGLHMKTFETEVVEKSIQDFKCSKNTTIAIRSTKEDEHKSAFYRLSAPYFKAKQICFQT